MQNMLKGFLPIVAAEEAFSKMFGVGNEEPRVSVYNRAEEAHAGCSREERFHYKLVSYPSSKYFRILKG